LNQYEEILNLVENSLTQIEAIESLENAITELTGSGYYADSVDSRSSNKEIPFADGGTISGSTAGYSIPEATFHGTEHIIPGSQMKEVANLLSEVKDVLVSIRDTDGNINKLTIKTNRILDRVTQGGTTIRTTEIA